MIAIIEEWPDGLPVVERGEWMVIKTHREEYSDIPDVQLPSAGVVRNGFRSPPLNPAKRIKGKKKKRK